MHAACRWKGTGGVNISLAPLPFPLPRVLVWQQGRGGVTGLAFQQGARARTRHRPCKWRLLFLEEEAPRRTTTPC